MDIERERFETETDLENLLFDNLNWYRRVRITDKFC